MKPLPILLEMSLIYARVTNQDLVSIQHEAKALTFPSKLLSNIQRWRLEFDNLTHVNNYSLFTCIYTS